MPTLSTTAARQPRGTPWTVDDLVMSEHATDLRISPDCRWAVWVKSAPDVDRDEQVLHVYLSSLAEQREIALTRGPDSCREPKWSPDGRHVAFLSARPLPKSKRTEDKPSQEKDKPRPQIWLLPLGGGEPWPLTAGERGVRDYEWADPDTLIYAAQEDPSLYERTVTEEKDTSVIVEDEEREPPVRLFRIAIESGKVTRLTDNDDRIRSLWVSPDGSRAVTVHERSLSYTYDNKVKPAVYLYDLKGGQRRQILAEARYTVGQISWTRDGAGFYVTSLFTTHPQYIMATITELHYYDLASGEVTQVDLDWERGIASQEQCFDVTGDGFVVLLAEGVRFRAARYVREAHGWRRAWLDGEHVRHMFRIVVGEDGHTLAYVYATASVPAQWYRAQLDEARVDTPVQITDVNAHLKGKPLARAEVVRWLGALDQEVEGMLYYPHDYVPGRRCPLVVVIHGGPAGVDLDAWTDSPGRPQNLLCARGAFVFKPNYHGSAHYGLDWAESISGGRYYELEVPDIEAGVDALIARGLVDPDRLGVMGWSNGGILTIALTVTTGRYNAASAGAGDVEWASDWGNCDFGAAFDNYYLGASPLQDPQRYVEKSPFYRLDRVRTPTIIFFGDQDRSVPTQQGWMHYRALQQSGAADVRFVLFPGEKHALLKLTHQRRKVREELAWFDRYLFEKTAAQPELKPGSPLATALELRKAMQDGKRYGLVVGDSGLLIPETLFYKGLEIGRFEVTRAQYAEFDPCYTVAPGTENYPANGLSFEQAQAFCAWLSAQTGEIYRLGTREEMEPIYDVKDTDENTLDYWAGYPVNPDEATRLRDAIAELGQGAPLLKEVGSLGGTKTDKPVFDLGGNVAEWAIDRDGSACVLGGSADTPADAKQDRRRPAPEYVGFRVVKGDPAGIDSLPA